ncbi:MAG: hypothetical protein HYY04_01385 [Chloroflexi bacterium]|nr:hypothetical protein [Chloroflexota bacterium]
MARGEDLLTSRKSLDEICSVPERIISVYSLEQHVWADGNSSEARRGRQPEVQTIEEFQINPVRDFLNDIFRRMAAPYRRERRDDPIGQGYWVQAEFGSGKSHLLCFIAALALGCPAAWEIVAEKERKAGRGRREWLYRFWEEGLAAKSSGGQSGILGVAQEGKRGRGETGKGIFVIVKTLVGAGGGAIGLGDAGRRLTEYILDAAREQLQLEIGKNLSLYPAELLADRFVAEDLDRYRADLRRFLRDPRFFEVDEFQDVDEFIRTIQENRSPEYKRSCGNKLWRFYTEYLKVQPHVAAETEEILKHLVETILAEGYSGVLLILDEVSLFTKNRGEDQRTDDEQTLVVLANRLARVHNLPIWTVCSAQQAIESRMGVKNIIADDRLKLVKLLEKDRDYYDIVLARVREITDEAAIGSYYLHYRRGFSWPNSIGEAEFRHFFPFHRPALEVLRLITYELTTTRSAIHFMHQTLKHQVASRGSELIRLWELFDETVRYEEDPSGVHAGLVAIQTSRESEYRAYEACRRQIDALTRGMLKVHRDKAIRTLQTLFLYHVARTRLQGLPPEEIANAVLIERDGDATVEENVEHYESLAESLKRELRQVVQTTGEEGRPRYRFDPVFTGVDPRFEFRRARDEVERSEVAVRDAWLHLVALDEWPVRTRQMTVDLSGGVRSIFRDIAPFVGDWKDRSQARASDQPVDLLWQGRQIGGVVGMRDFADLLAGNRALPPIATDETDHDFAVFVATRPVLAPSVVTLLEQRKDPRVLLWTPAELTPDERERLIDFAAYRKLVRDWQGKETEDAVAVVTWVANALRADLGTIAKIVEGSYGRGRIDALGHSELEFRVAGELRAILGPLVDRVLTATYESRDIRFDGAIPFRRDDAAKVVNGIVKKGGIPRETRPNQDVSAAQNFAAGLRIVKRSAERVLDVSENRYVQDLWAFLDENLADERQRMNLETLYKNFTGIRSAWNGKSYGLTRRMVQIYLLCLVQQGKVRVSLGPRAGLSQPTIDYASIAGVDFSARVLDALAEVQKLARPENWEVLRPYAEKLLGAPIPDTHDDAEISASRARLRELFAAEGDAATRLSQRAKGLFERLGSPNPYARPLEQCRDLFGIDITTGDDISLILYGLKQAFGYQAFDTNAASAAEVDDLAVRLRNYRDLKRFFGYEAELRAACAYRDYPLPDLPDLQRTRASQRQLAEKLSQAQPFIDSEVKLRTELIGHSPPVAGESGTLESLLVEYTGVYSTLHDSAIDRLEGLRKGIQAILVGDDLRALKVLEGITALQPAAAAALEGQIVALGRGVFACPTPSRSSVAAELRSRPEHQCGLSFANAAGHLQAAEAALRDGRALLDGTLDRKVEVFLSESVRARLRQGRGEAIIAGVLERTERSALRAYLVEQSLKDPSIVGTINRYLRRIVVRKVRLADFKPSRATVEEGQLGQLSEEFRAYLEAELRAIEATEDTLPMLQVE